MVRAVPLPLLACNGPAFTFINAVCFVPEDLCTQQMFRVFWTCVKSTDPTKLGRPTQIIKLTGDFNSHFFYHLLLFVPISMAARSKAWICGRVFAATVGLNPAVCMDVCLLWVLCVCAVRVGVKNYERSVLWVIHEHSLDSDFFFFAGHILPSRNFFFILFCTFCSFFNECLT